MVLEAITGASGFPDEMRGRELPEAIITLKLRKRIRMNVDTSTFGKSRLERNQPLGVFIGVPFVFMGMFLFGF